MIKLSFPKYTLADAYDYLESINSSLIRAVTPQQLSELLAINPLYKQAAYQSIQVYIRHKDKHVVHLVHSNLGYMYFNHHDIFENYILDDPLMYFDYKIEDYTAQIFREDIVFCKKEETSWKARFDYESILNHYGLSGYDDFAPFVGFYKLTI